MRQLPDCWADKGGALGWTTLEICGVHPEVGTVRPDFCGAQVLRAERVSEIAETRMQFVNTTYYRNTPGRPTGAVPLWRLGQ